MLASQKKTNKDYHWTLVSNEHQNRFLGKKRFPVFMQLASGSSVDLTSPSLPVDEDESDRFEDLTFDSQDLSISALCSILSP